MATTFDQIYGVFFDKSRDYELYELAESTSKEVLFGYLKTAIARFGKTCEKDLSDRDDTNETFNVELSDTEIDILSEWMCYAFLKTKRNTSDLFRNGLSTKDYVLFSPANLLKAVQEAYKECAKECRSLMNEYSYDSNNVESLKKNGSSVVE